MKIFFKFFCLLALAGCVQTERSSKDSSHIHRPFDAIWRVLGVHFPYCLWYNPHHWMILSSPLYDTERKDQEWLLVLLEEDDRSTIGKDSPIKSVAFTFSYDEKNRDPEEIKSRVIKNLLSNLKNVQTFEDLGSEEKIVNGAKIWEWRIHFSSAELGEQMFANTYYSDGEGSVALVTLTPMKYWKSDRQKIEDLLNGFCLSKNAQKL